MTLSLNGWPVIPAHGDPRLKTGAVPGADRRLTTRKEALPLFLAIAADWHRWINPIDQGTWDEGGYNNRDARSVPGRKSNHASGTAIDLDWGTIGAPSKASRLFWARKDKRSKIEQIKKIYRIVNWGGDWSGSNWDPMHIELKPGTSPSDVARVIAKLSITNEGVRTKNWAGLPLKAGVK